MLRTHVHFGLSKEYRLPVDIEENFDSGSGNCSGRDAGVRERYENCGYVIVRKLVQPTLCDELISAFRTEVKPFGGPLLRQASARPGPHLYTPDGFMANALLSIQDFVEPRFHQFRTRAIDVMAGRDTQTIVGDLLMDVPLLVESMYFESTLVGVPLHADGDYMDSDVPGMIGAWFALEDIAPLAGRFVLAPRSHRLEAGASTTAAAYYDFRSKQARTSATMSSDMRTNLKRRLEEAALLHRAILDGGISLVAPMLEKGDAIFWSAGLIHGSLPPESRNQSRNSLTAHYISNSRALMVHGQRVDFLTETHHGMKLRMMRTTD